MYRLVLKSLLDKLLAGMAFVILFPVCLLLILGLALANKGNPFFLQCRPGKDGRLFKLIKFKTMNDQKDEKGRLLPDERRLTLVGKIVRKTSLDEIPQLINVLKGDMSLVGPRPLLIEYLPLYNEKQSRRHEVRPGITGWAQVNGRNNVPWKQRFEYDVWYVDHYSFAIDIKVLYLTVIKVFKSEGISQEGQATVQLFTGNNE